MPIRIRKEESEVLHGSAGRQSGWATSETVVPGPWVSLTIWIFSTTIVAHLR